jgi:3-hydroxyacyl-CoA dehydrogenase
MSTSKPIRRVTIIGTGVIGASWAALYLAKGLKVAATDIAPNAEADLKLVWLRQWSIESWLEPDVRSPHAIW